MPGRQFPDKNSSYIHQVLDSTVLESKVTPTWFKVSNTCYDVHSKKVSGYGRAIRNISVSPDCPNSFFRTEHIIRPKDFTPAPKEIASRKAGVEASYVLPGGSSFSEQPLKGRRYTKLYTNNQLIIEPKVTSRSGGGIDLTWDSSRRSARPSTSVSSSQLPLSPVKWSGRNNSILNSGGLAPPSRNQASPSVASRALSTGPMLQSARARTASSTNSRMRSTVGFSNTPKSFSTSNKKSWWIHED